MTSWPWMKGCTTAIADPIPPVTAQDDRPSVKKLIDDHRHLIVLVKHELCTNPLFDTNKHDDLWIVRFLLSHKKKVKDAVKAASFTLAFRKEHKLDETDIRSFPVGTMDSNCESFRRYLKHCSDDAVRIVVPDEQRGVIGFLRVAGVDHRALAEHVDESDWLPSFLHISEWTHQWLDFVTRTTGRLTKSPRLVDAAGITLAATNKEISRRDGKAMGTMEDCYPQLLQTIFVCNAPMWVQIPWRLMRPLFPKRVVEKFDFIDPEKNENERKRLLKHISLEHLPVRFGGLNETWPVDFSPPSTNG